MDPGAVDH